MNRFHLKLFSLIILGLCCSTLTQAQSTQSSRGFDEWKWFAPPTGGFNIRFPEMPTERTDSVEIAGKPITNHEYLARHVSEYRVNYFAIPSDLKNSQAALLKGLANSVVSEYKGAVASEREYAIQGAAGRMLKINTANGAVVQALILAADARVYRVIASVPRQSAGNPDEISTANKFLESFVIVPVVSAPPDDRYLVTEEGEVDRFLKKESVGSIPANAGTVNSKATNLVTPRFPLALPPNKHYSETVEIKLIIDERGVVVAAQVFRGHPWFRDVALDAARKSRFEPTLVAGKPVKVQGTIIYNFVKN